MVTFVTVAASMEACRSFEFEVLGTAESHDALQSFLEALPESPERAILAVVVVRRTSTIRGGSAFGRARPTPSHTSRIPFL
jgi:hypothetical protein